MASLSCPDCGVKVQPEDLICFRCGANLPHSPGPDDDLLTPTISQRFIAAGADPTAFCPNCGTAVDDAADVVCSTCGDPLPTGRRRAIREVIRTTAPMHDGFAGGAFLDTSGALLSRSFATSYLVRSAALTSTPPGAEFSPKANLLIYGAGLSLG